MNAKNLQKATVLLKEIHELDSQLIKLDKKAMSIANGEEHLNISLLFEKEKKDSDQKSEIEDLYSIRFSFMGMMGNEKVEKTENETYKFKMSDKECLYVIGALISAKREYRKQLCDRIIELGVTV